MTEAELKTFGKKIVDYCFKFDVPLPFLFDILEDQKVTPMIRGKAMEYNAFLLLKDLLSPSAWIVEKLNLNPQPGSDDEDISVKHRRTAIVLKVESKSAVRGSMTDGVKAKVLRGFPRFNVKCHRSRSNKSLTTNDRYSDDSFDVLITNPQNAIYEKGTVSEDFEILKNKNIRSILDKHYGVSTDAELAKACYNDWRFCFPTEISVHGFIPRTPYVGLIDDPIWKPLNTIEARLNQLVSERAKSSKRG